jgi:hypothetical protein
MTNLIEKTLIIGFGIFIASIFLTFSIPFLDNILYYNNILEDDLNDYLKIINDVDEGILYIIENPNQIYQKEIYYPNNLNITLDGQYVNFEYYFQGEISVITLKYNTALKSCKFYDIVPQSYLYQVFLDENLIKIEII